MTGYDLVWSGQEICELFFGKGIIYLKSEQKQQVN